MKPFALLNIALISLVSHAQELTHSELVGFWQDMPIVASGYSDHYQFFEDGTFVHGHNQMNCADSVISEQGSYRLKKNKLKLSYTSVTEIVGGTLVPAEGSCGSDYQIEGGTIQERPLRKREVIVLKDFGTDPEFEYLTRLSIGHYYWKLSSDPVMY